MNNAPAGAGGRTGRFRLAAPTACSRLALSDAPKTRGGVEARRADYLLLFENNQGKFSYAAMGAFVVRHSHRMFMFDGGILGTDLVAL